MRLSIITPSFRSSQWLRLCIASVADQAGAELEHIVQDSCSDDATSEWLPKDSRVNAFIEKDQGMYDAVNRGFRRSTGEILAYLNCDEQYLPGALKAVHDYFAAHPGTDVLFADTVVVNTQGQYVCSRRSLVPWKNVMWVYSPVITSSIFIHQRVLREQGMFFDTKWRDLGDKLWILEMLRRGLKMAVLRRFTSSFTDTGENMNLKPNAMREKEEVMRMAPALVRRFKWPLLQLHRLRRLVHGHHWEKPFSYSIYTLTRPELRTDFPVTKPTAIWWTRR